MTSDNLPNPWDSLPSYFDDMAELLDGGSSAPTDPEYSLIVKSVDQTGKAITGMRMEVKKDGAIIRTGFTPLSLALEEGSYTVSAGNYQQIIFDHWQDGSRSSTASVSLSVDSELTAHHNSGAIAPLSVALKADKATASVGAGISFSVTIQGGTAPYTWSVNFGDGTSSSFTSASSIPKTYSSAGTFSAVATARDSAGKTAASSPVSITITPNTSTLIVNTVDAAGSPINGYYTVLSQNGATVKTASSPASFILNSGQTYQVSVSDYGDYAFDHWDNGSTSKSRTITPNNNTVLTAY